MQHENLIELLDVGGDVVVREDHAFGVAGRAAGKNNRRDVVKSRPALATRKFSQSSGWQEARSEHGGKTLTEPGVPGDVFDENHFAGRLNLDLFEKDPRGHNRF